MSVSTRAVVTAALAAGVAAAAFVSTLALAGAAVALVVLLALGWPGLLRLPAEGGTRLVVMLSGIGSVAVAYATPGEPVLRYLPMVLAAGMVLAFLAEMMRRGGRPRLVESVSGSVAGVVVALACAGWVAAGRSEAGAALVVTSAAAIALAAALSAVPLKGWARLAVTLGAAVVAGGAVATVLPNIDTVSGLWSGVVAGLVVGALHLLLEQLPALRRRLPGLAASVLPVAVGGILVFVVGRMVVG
ncbi:hypothetical protein [Antribacter gilvus]|uniref:hypothetical protein n=1 Tax=Antribacter gilvus TaxID=2304675 RepID=UPI000F78A9E8|nr:hypothetical protein [Antribacter gilvus]